MKFAMGWDLDCLYLDTPMYVSLLFGVVVWVDQVYSASLVMFMGFKTLTDLVILDINEFDVILAMTWSYSYHAIFYCNVKTITTVITEIDKLEWKGPFMPNPVRVVSAIHA